MSDRVKQYFVELQNAINEDDKEDDVIDIASSILNLIPNDVETRHCRVVAYLKLGMFQEAYQDLEKLDGLAFEKCYCLYGLKRFRESLKQIEALPQEVQNEEQFLALRQQIYFSLDDAANCKKILEQTEIDETDYDKLVNISACLYVTGDEAKSMQLLNKEESLIEQVYNTACLLVKNGNMAEASELIEMGLGKVEEGTMYFQLFRILKAEVLAKTNTSEACEILLSIIDNNDSHPYAKRLAASNYVALVFDDNVHLAKKKIHLFDISDEFDELRKSDVESFLINRFLVLHKIGQPGKIKALIEYTKKHKNIDLLIAESFERIIEPDASTETEYSPLFKAQMLISQNKLEAAAKILADSKLAIHPRTISVVVELFLASQKKEEALNFLKKVNLKTPEFYEYAAKFAINNDFHSEAINWSELYMKASNNSPNSIGLYSIALADDDIEMAERYAHRIKFQQLNSEEIDRLENERIEKAQSKTQSKSKETSFGVENKKQRRVITDYTPEQLKRIKDKKRRRRRLKKPENYDPNRNMNPERWIKLKNRASQKRKAKKNQKKKR